MNIIPHSKPTVGKEESLRVVNVIESAQLAQGPVVQKFEQDFARKTCAGYAAAVTSGTAALHLTLLALGVGPEDEVIIPSYVCTALLNAVHYVGATPVLADIDPDTYNLDPVDVSKHLTGQTRAVIVPHLFGLAAEMQDFRSLGVPIIEDCAQAVGGTYREKPVGAHGEAAIYSFYATKVMTTGEGGMVASDSKGLIDRVKELREYDNVDKYKIRYNYKMTDIQAAMGLSQLARLNSFIENRRAIAEKYRQAFQSLDIKLPFHTSEHIYYRYVVGLKTDPEQLIRRLAGRGITCARPVHHPLHFYQGLKDCPQTEKVWRQSLSIPIYPSLRENEMKRVIAAFKDVYKGGNL